jgi:hypothetical protein
MMRAANVNEEDLRKMFDFFCGATNESLLEILMAVVDATGVENGVAAGTLAAVLGAYVGANRDDINQIENDILALANVILRSATVYRDLRLKAEKETAQCH